MSGTKVAAPIFPTGTFPAVYETDLQGSYRSVADIPARNAIPSIRRKVGAVVYVISNNTYYQLQGGITNGNWVVWNPSGSSGSYLSVTYSNFETALLSSSLSPGALYLINDFRSYYEYTPTLYSGAIEPLFVIATSSNTVSNRAFSTLFPDDIIEYDPTSDVINQRGKITFRKNIALALSAYFDWRSIKIRRWETASGNEEYLSNVDTGFASFDFYAFGGTGFIGGSPANSESGGFCTGGSCTYCELSIGTSNVVIANGNQYIKVGDKWDVTGVTIYGTGNNRISFDSNMGNVIVGPNNTAIEISASEVEIGDNNSNIYIKQSNNSNFTIGDNNTMVYIGNDCGSIQIGDSNSNIHIGNRITDIIIDNNCNNIRLCDGFNLFSLSINILSNNSYRDSSILNNDFEQEVDLNNPINYSGGVLDITDFRWATNLNLAGTPGTFVVNNITTGSVNLHKIILRPQTGIQLQLNGTPLISAGMGDIAIDNISGTLTLNGDSGDWMLLEQRNGIWYQIGAGGYY